MLRTVLLFFFLLGFATPEMQAARPLHRHKPMAGNYRPVYKLYRGHSQYKNGFFSLFKHRSAARHHGLLAPKSKARRGTL